MIHALVFGGAIALAALLTAVVRSWYAYAPGEPDRIGWPKSVPLIATVFGTFFAGRAAWGLFTEQDVRWLIVFVPGAVAIALFLPALVCSDAVIAGGQLSGPASLMGPFPWFSRNTIRLSDIKSIGAAPYDYTFVEGHDGRRVYICANGPGSTAFIARLNDAASAATAEGKCLLSTQSCPESFLITTHVPAPGFRRVVASLL